MVTSLSDVALALAAFAKEADEISEEIKQLEKRKVRIIVAIDALNFAINSPKYKSEYTNTGEIK